MCLFCKIAAGQVSANIVHQDSDVVAFHDINPQAPVHFLVIPRKHIDSLATATEQDEQLLGKLLLTARKIAEQQGLQSDGYRTVINTGKQAGQTVFHIHVHVLGARPMAWPPG